MAVRLTTLLLLALLSAASAQQEIAPPDPRKLSAEWWNYVSEAGDNLKPRIESLLQATEAIVAAGDPGQELGPYLNRLRLNLGALPQLRAETGESPPPVPTAAEAYRLGQVLDLQRLLRKTRRELLQLNQVNERAQISITAAQRRIDTLKASYLTLAETAPSRLLKGLQIMASRAELASSREQLRVRSETRDALAGYQESIAGLIEHAADNIIASDDELATIVTQREQLAAKLTQAQEELRERQARALGAAGASPAERADRSLRQLLMLETAATESDLRLQSARLTIEQQLLELLVAGEGNGESVGTVLRDSAEQLQRLRAELDAWEQQAEQELLALRTEQARDPQLIRIDNRRLQTANQVLLNISQARESASDLDFARTLLQQRLVAGRGVIGGGFAAFMLWLDETWTGAKQWGEASLFRIGDTPVTLFGLMRVAVILFVGIWLSRLFRHVLDRLGSRSEGTQSAFYTVGRLAHYAIIAAAILIGLSSIGLNFSNLAIVVGALGVGIGFGLQSIVNNFVSGLILLFERSLKVGDYVELESGVGGIVKEINVRSTLINTNQNLDILVPNSEFVSGRLTNWTHKDISRRMHIPFGVAYGSDKDKVKRVVLEKIREVPYTVTDEPQRGADVWLTNFGDSSLDFELVVWVKQASVKNPGRVHAAYTWAIETALGENGIEIPFPQRDLHLRSGFAGSGQAGAG